VRVLFFGTPEFAAAVLEALLRTRHQVVGLVSQPSRPRGRGLVVEDPPAVALARQAGVPVFQPARLHAPETFDALRALAPDVIVTAAFGRILRPSLLSLPPRGCWNVHASLLPRHRGASPVSAALLSGDAWTGITVFHMDEGLDTGAILHQEMTAIGPGETCGDLTARLALLGGKVLLEALEMAERGGLTARPQPMWGVTYAPVMEKEDGRVPWNRPVEQVDRVIRASIPWPGAFTFLDGSRLRVHRARPLHRIPLPAVPGTVVSCDGGIQVACRPGVILCEEVQSEGRRRQVAADWLRGNRVPVGTRLDPS
jgi:methionyl-tRNA formyltransferase